MHIALARVMEGGEARRDMWRGRGIVGRVGLAKESK